MRLRTAVRYAVVLAGVAAGWNLARADTDARAAPGAQAEGRVAKPPLATPPYAPDGRPQRPIPLPRSAPPPPAAKSVEAAIEQTGQASVKLVAPSP